MDNYLESGGVLPSGLLSGNDDIEKIGAFNKTYKNYPLRLGVITDIYEATDPLNFSKLATEYNVSVFEQNEDRGSTVIKYKNCLYTDSLGSIADFVDLNLRSLTQNKNIDNIINTKNQNGATVILLCLDAVSEKAIIMGGLPHPDRPTTLLNTNPYLQAEYNGVNVVINNDGSTALTFKGATDSYGVPTDPSQGNTVFQIKTDGSFEFKHSTIDILADKSGKLTITAKGDLTVSCANATVTAMTTATIDAPTINLGAGATDAVIKGTTFAKLYNSHQHIGNLGSLTSAVIVPMDSSLSTVVNTE
jgi:hypothetical protein